MFDMVYCLSLFWKVVPHYDNRKVYIHPINYFFVCLWHVSFLLAFFKDYAWPEQKKGMVFLPGSAIYGCGSPYLLPIKKKGKLSHLRLPTMIWDPGRPIRLINIPVHYSWPTCNVSSVPSLAWYKGTPLGMTIMRFSGTHLVGLMTLSSPWGQRVPLKALCHCSRSLEFIPEWMLAFWILWMYHLYKMIPMYVSSCHVCVKFQSTSDVDYYVPPCLRKMLLVKLWTPIQFP